jgi:hypothetical protein
MKKLLFIRQTDRTKCLFIPGAVFKSNHIGAALLDDFYDFIAPQSHGHTNNIAGGRHPVDHAGSSLNDAGVKAAGDFPAALSLGDYSVQEKDFRFFIQRIGMLL